MRCRYCDKSISIFKSLKGESFCSQEHRELFLSSESQNAIDRLLEFVQKDVNPEVPPVLPPPRKAEPKGKPLAQRYDALQTIDSVSARPTHDASVVDEGVTPARRAESDSGQTPPDAPFRWEPPRRQAAPLPATVSIGVVEPIVLPSLLTSGLEPEPFLPFGVPIVDTEPEESGYPSEAPWGGPEVVAKAPEVTAKVPELRTFPEKPTPVRVVREPSMDVKEAPCPPAPFLELPDGHYQADPESARMAELGPALARALTPRAFPGPPELSCLETFPPPMAEDLPAGWRPSPESVASRLYSLAMGPLSRVSALEAPQVSDPLRVSMRGIAPRMQTERLAVPAAYTGPIPILAAGPLGFLAGTVRHSMEASASDVPAPAPRGLVIPAPSAIFERALGGSSLKAPETKAFLQPATRPVSVDFSLQPVIWSGTARLGAALPRGVGFDALDFASRRLNTGPAMNPGFQVRFEGRTASIAAPVLRPGGTGFGRWCETSPQPMRAFSLPKIGQLNPMRPTPLSLVAQPTPGQLGASSVRSFRPRTFFPIPVAVAGRSFSGTHLAAQYHPSCPVSWSQIALPGRLAAALLSIRLSKPSQFSELLVCAKGTGCYSVRLAGAPSSTLKTILQPLARFASPSVMSPLRSTAPVTGQVRPIRSGGLNREVSAIRLARVPRHPASIFALAPLVTREFGPLAGSNDPSLFFLNPRNSATPNVSCLAAAVSTSPGPWELAAANVAGNGPGP